MDEWMRPRAARRPVYAAAAALAIGAILVALAAGASDRIAPAPLDGHGISSLEIVTAAPPGTTPRVQAVAVEAIVSALRADPAVAAATAARSAGTSALIDARLNVPGEHEAALAITRIEKEVDPGPLELRFVAAPLVLEDARSSVQGDLGKLELLVVPFAILVLVATGGARGGALAALAATIALAGALAALRLSGGYLVAFAPAAAIGLVQAIELSSLFTAIHREEVLLIGGGDPVRRALSSWSGPAVIATAVRALAPLALLVTSFAEAGSIALASGVASLLALGSVAALGPWILRLGQLRARDAGGVEGRASGAVRVAPRVIARSRRALAAALTIVVLASLALAAPVRDAASTPLGAGDLPAGSQARSSAATLPPAEPATRAAGGSDEGDNPLPDLVLAAALLGIGIGIPLPAGHARRAGAALSLLPAAATLGLAVLVVQQGHVAGSLTGRRGSLVEGAVVACLAAVAVISAGRTALAASLARAEARTGVGRIGAAEITAGLAMPGVLASTLVVAGVFGALGGADLGAARELGVAVAAGAVLDLVLVRIPFLAVLARWSE